jgi:hypothetical protein
MVIDMNNEQLSTLAGFARVFRWNRDDGFHGCVRGGIGVLSRIVKRFEYRRLKRADKAIVLRFLERVSGYSRQHVRTSMKEGKVVPPFDVSLSQKIRG